MVWVRWVLVQLAQRLRQVFRETDSLVRWGGEEVLALVRETDRLRKQLVQLQTRVEDLTANESVLQETLTTAQKLSEDLKRTAAKEGVPVIAYADKLTQAGALFSLGPDFEDIGAQAGDIVNQIRAGSPPSTIGIQSARKAALTINKRVATALGIDIPADAYKRAAATYD